MSKGVSSAKAIQDEVDDLSARLQATQVRLADSKTSSLEEPNQNASCALARSEDGISNIPGPLSPVSRENQAERPSVPIVAPTQHHYKTRGRSNYDLHHLLLLSDSALPLGSFAFSSGLESFLAHTSKSLHTQPATFSRFLDLSLASLASTTLPYVIAGWASPDELEDLDNDLDASLMCVVARRASIQQGRALLAVWERSFCPRSSTKDLPEHINSPEFVAQQSLSVFSKALKAQPLRSDIAIPTFDAVLQPNGHLPPLFGCVCAAVGIPMEQCLYVYLLNHSKTLVSAAIRASVLGPYAAQAVLASEGLQSTIWALVNADTVEGRGYINDDAATDYKRRGTSDAGQSVPALDLWQGRHEIIYSRIFNS